MTGFLKAVPVWLRGRSEEKNVQAVFQTELEYGRHMGTVIMNITAASLYKLWVNGRFAAYGPARAPHGYARIDRVDITGFLREGTNSIRIDVAGYYCYSYYMIRQPSFLQAELLYEKSGEAGGKARVLAATGMDFIGYLDCRRIKKVMRYSFQRTFSEVWNGNFGLVRERTEQLDLGLQYLERGVPFPERRILDPAPYGWKGTFYYEELFEFCKDRYITQISETVSGYREDEIAAKPYYRWQSMRFSGKREKVPLHGCVLREGEWLLLDMGRNCTGFICCSIAAAQGCHYMISFDEILIDGSIDFHRMKMLNLLDYEVPSGEDRQESFEVYGLRYACIMVTKGELCLKSFGIRDFGYPLKTGAVTCRDGELDRIYHAALETFHQNVVDVYMDCPTRERAGWLCDSYFTSFAEQCFTGQNAAERCFMENYRLYPGLDSLPEGMLPMCYPADHPDGKYIPQWAMWYVLELKEFLERSADVDPGDYRELCYKLLDFFVLYENEWGLLERLPSWNFVEWSGANSWVWDVNYPTNMLYGRMCRIIGELYSDRRLEEKGRQIRKTVIEKAFDGTYFCDHAVRDAQGELQNAADISEVCQYYAVLFLEIQPDDSTFAGLVKAVCREFAVARAEDRQRSLIEPANDFIGLYLRLQILFQWGRYGQLKEEIKILFSDMAARTGTLWEKRDIYSSLNHGFGSYVGALIQKMEFRETEKENERSV